MTRKQHRKKIEDIANKGIVTHNGIMFEVTEQEQAQAKVVLQIMDANAAWKKKKYEAMKKAKLRIYKFMSPLNGKNKAQRACITSGIQSMNAGNQTLVYRMSQQPRW